MKKSFSLLELIIVIAILAVTISTLLMVFIYCAFLDEANRNLVIAANDTQNMLEDIKVLAFDDIENYSSPTVSNLQNEALSVTVTQINSSIKEVTASVSWSDRQRSRTFQLSTRFAR